MRIDSARFCTVIGLSVLLAFALGAKMPSSSASGVARVEASPHVSALELLFKHQAEAIRRLDTENWWHDVKERTWSVKRPLYPGGIDSTHLFVVTYRIDGSEVGRWNVDTARGEATLLSKRNK